MTIKGISYISYIIVIGLFFLSSNTHTKYFLFTIKEKLISKLSPCPGQLAFPIWGPSCA